MTVHDDISQKTGNVSARAGSTSTVHSLIWLAAAGIVCAVLAEVARAGLLAVSGWFIAACALAGVTLGSTFSYVIPSAMVRAFVLARIALDYVQRLLQHRFALDEQGEQRALLLERFNGARIGSGRLLDQAVSDVDEYAMRHIRVTAPMYSAASVSLIAVAIIWPFSQWVSAIILGASALSVPVALVSGRHVSQLSAFRADSREFIADSVGSRDDMASVGAAPFISAAVRVTMRRLGLQERRASGGFATTAIAVLWAFAMMLGGLLTADGQADVATLCLVLLLISAVSGSWAALPASVQHARRLGLVRGRLRRSGASAANPGDPAGKIKVRIAASTDCEPRFQQHVRQQSKFSDELDLEAMVPSNSLSGFDRHCDVIMTAVPSLTFVSGRSGAGKTTLLTALNRQLGDLVGLASIMVTVDDHIFTGTVADNLRIADPSLSEDEMGKLLKLLDLTDIDVNTPVGVGGRELSGGEMTRLRIARGLLAHPDVLLVDEPTSGLDRRRITIVMDLLRAGYARRVVIAMHDPTNMGVVREGDRLVTL